MIVISLDSNEIFKNIWSKQTTSILEQLMWREMESPSSRKRTQAYMQSRFLCYIPSSLFKEFKWCLWTLFIYRKIASCIAMDMIYDARTLKYYQRCVQLYIRLWRVLERGYQICISTLASFRRIYQPKLSHIAIKFWNSTQNHNSKGFTTFAPPDYNSENHSLHRTTSNYHHITN